MIKCTELYDEVCKVLPKEKISHWCSTLYFKKTEETQKLIKNYEYPNDVKTFIDAIDHELWYEVWFAYPLVEGMRNP